MACLHLRREAHHGILGRDQTSVENTSHHFESNPCEIDAAGLLTSSKLEQHAAVALVLPFAAVAFYAIGKVLDGVLYGRQVRASAFSGSKEQSRLVQ